MARPFDLNMDLKLKGSRTIIHCALRDAILIADFCVEVSRGGLIEAFIRTREAACTAGHEAVGLTSRFSGENGPSIHSQEAQREGARNANIDSVS